MLKNKDIKLNKRCDWPSVPLCTTSVPFFFFMKPNASFCGKFDANGGSMLFCTEQYLQHHMQSPYFYPVLDHWNRSQRGLKNCLFLMDARFLDRDGDLFSPLLLWLSKVNPGLNSGDLKWVEKHVAAQWTPLSDINFIFIYIYKQWNNIFRYCFAQHEKWKVNGIRSES